MRIRIVTKPKEKELDGVALDVFRPGKVCDVSSSIGAWLIANGYALSEMRAPITTETATYRSGDRRRHQR